MSDNYDYQKRPKKGPPNYKGSKKPNRDYPIYYETKNPDKNQREYYDSYKGNNGGNYRDDYYQKGSRYDNTGGYRPKQPHRQHSRGDDQRPNYYKKRAIKLSKIDVMECYPRAGILKELAELLENYPEAFSKDRIKAENEDVFQLDPDEGLMPRFSANRGNFNNPPDGNDKEGGNKGLELYDLGQERYDPIRGNICLN
jgi:hypothetical protein